jgi:hypothetical protein
MTDPTALKLAIDNLSEKQHVVSEDARRAKAQQFRHDIPQLARTQVLLSELNRSSRYLSAIFKQADCDSLLLFLAKPFQLFMMQFMVGIVRGMGVLFGVLFLLVIILHTCKVYLPVTFFIQLHDYLGQLKH